MHLKKGIFISQKNYYYYNLPFLDGSTVIDLCKYCDLNIKYYLTDTYCRLASALNPKYPAYPKYMYV